MNDQENHVNQDELISADEQAQRDEALYGPRGRGEYKKGDSIRFKDPQTQETLTGEVLYTRAPGEAVRGGRKHPTVYIVHVAGEDLPRAVYTGDIIQE